jgi:phosphoglycerol transferase
MMSVVPPDAARRIRAWLERAAPYFAAAVLSLIAAAYLLDLRNANLRVPFVYRRDALLYASVIKGVIDHGWFWRNPSIGAPSGLLLYDYPNVAHEALHLLAIKVLSIFTGDWALLLNVYFVLGFPLIALAAVAVLRRLGVSASAAVVGGLLYAFLPARLLKNEGHIFLATFFQVPLLILMLLWVCSEAPPVVWLPPARRGPDYRQRRCRGLAALIICGVSASASAYYSFFAICLLVAAGLWAAIERRSTSNLIAGIALAATITGAIAAVGWPSIAYHHREGPNAEVGRRSPAEAELYGMKIAQLLLPTDGHRISTLQRFKERYSKSAPFSDGENSMTSLGFVGDIGFLVLLGAMFVGWRNSSAGGDWFLRVAKLNLAVVLLATVGGAGSLFAYLAYTQIRSYSRASVFVGFFALFAVLALLDRLKRRFPYIGFGVLVLVLLIGLFDQATPLAVRAYADIEHEFDGDRDFFRTLESRVPRGTMIFQLPYVQFPEGPPVHKLDTNDPLRGYLHSAALRWSLPTMYGRSGDQFVRRVAAQAPDEMLATLAATGFTGVLVSRDGYADAGAAIEAQLRVALGGTQPMVGADGRLAFFDLSLRKPSLPPDEVARILHPITIDFSAGFYPLEAGGSGRFRWAERTSVIDVNNDTGLTRRFSLSAVLSPAQPPANLVIEGDLVAARLTLDGPTPFRRVLELPPGHHVLRFSSDGRPADAPHDPREMVWRFESFAFEELPNH